MLKINDTILYGNDGVCKVVEQTTKELCGQTKEYYVLKPVLDDNSTIYVPVDGAKAAEKIRPILSREEIYALIQEMPQEQTMEELTDQNKRNERNREIVSGGDRKQLIRLIKTLYLASQEKKSEGKKLCSADEQMMKQAEKILYEEFSHVLQIKQEEVLPFIIHQIEMEENRAAE